MCLKSQRSALKTSGMNSIFRKLGILLGIKLSHLSLELKFMRQNWLKNVDLPRKKDRDKSTKQTGSKPKKKLLESLKKRDLPEKKKRESMNEIDRFEI